MPPTKGRKIAASRARKQTKKQTRLPFEAVDQSPSSATSSRSGPSRTKARYATSATLKSEIPTSSVDGESESDDPITSSVVPARDEYTAALPKRNGKIPFKKVPLPTPMKSSQLPGLRSTSNGSKEDSEDEVTNTTTTPHQTQSSAMRSIGVREASSRKAKIHIDSGSSDGSLPEENAYTPSKSSKKSKNAAANLGEEIYTPAGKDTGNSRRLEVVIFSQEPKEKSARHLQKSEVKDVITISSHTSEEANEELPISRKSSLKSQPSPSRPSRSSSKKKAHVWVELSSDSESEDLELPPTQRSSRAKKPPLFSMVPKGNSSSPIQEHPTSSNEFPPQKKLQLSGVKKALFDSVSKGKPSLLQAEEDSDSDDVVMSTQPVRRKRIAIAIPSPLDDEDDDQDVASSPLKRRRPAVESEDSDVVSSPLKRKRPNNIYSQDAETDDELPNTKKTARSNARESTPVNRSTRQSKTRRHRTEKDKKLELLKRRRAGEAIEALTESEESDSEEESGSELQELSEFEDEEEEVVVAKPSKPAKKREGNSKDDENLDEYDSDFIEDDDDGDIGVPMLDIPLMFTHAAHKPLKEHFKDAVEWMVHAKINPGFSRDDPLYVQAFKKLDDEYGGYAKSKFVSTQWTAEFIRAIYARPEFMVRDLAPGEEIDIAGEVICQVCNHRKYVPKYEIQFSGKAYHRDSLEEVDQDDSSDDSDGGSKDSQKHSVNADGQVIPAEERTWLSGRYCKANAEQAHSLIHWKYALNQWVLGNLEIEGYLTPANLALREKMKPKQRRKCANDIVDDWEANRQIKDLYRDFKINLETARNADNSSSRRFGR